MPWMKAIFLIMILVGTSGYRFRCYSACIDQTSTQNDYIEQRDRCRSYAETKLDFAMKNVKGPADDKSRKAMLVSLFSECMAAHGWNVPDGKPPGAAAAPAAPTVPAVNVNAENEARKKAALSRSAECTFSRSAADMSANAAARARACDLECAQRLKAAPEAPRPAACSSGSNPALEVGRDREQ